MNQKSSFFLAILFIANPMVLLLFQNCSTVSQANSAPVEEPRKPAALGEKTVSEHRAEPTRFIHEKSF